MSHKLTQSNVHIHEAPRAWAAWIGEDIAAAEKIKTFNSQEEAMEFWDSLPKSDDEDSYDTFMDHEDEPTRENPDSRNRWAKQLGSQTTYDAGKLLDLIRPEVEAILVSSGIFSPPSQSVRVRQCIERMEAQCLELQKSEKDVMCPKLNFRQWSQLNRMVRTLKAFQAVHETITILEGTVI